MVFIVNGGTNPSHIINNNNLSNCTQWYFNI